MSEETTILRGLASAVHTSVMSSLPSEVFASAVLDTLVVSSGPKVILLDSVKEWPEGILMTKFQAIFPLIDSGISAKIVVFFGFDREKNILYFSRSRDERK